MCLPDPGRTPPWWLPAVASGWRCFTVTLLFDPTGYGCIVRTRRFCDDNVAVAATAVLVAPGHHLALAARWAAAAPSPRAPEPGALSVARGGKSMGIANWAAPKK